MTPNISIKEIVDELEVLFEESTAFVNRKTGKPVTISDEDISILEDGSDRELPDWQQEFIDSVRAPYEAGDLIELPSQFDVDEYAMLEGFSQEQTNPDHRGQLLSAITGRGAFRNFKDTCDRLGLMDDWFRYRTQAYEVVVKDWIRGNSIALGIEDAGS